MTMPQQPPQGQYPQRGPANPAPQPAPPQKVSLLQAFKPEPAKAPPLEWVALVVSLLLAISGFLPWVTGAGNASYSGLDVDYSRGLGWIMLGAGLVSAVMGFVGLSRDSISLAAGQGFIGLITLIFALLNLSPGEGYNVGFGVYLAIVASIILIALSIYNAFDARRKGATY